MPPNTGRLFGRPFPFQEQNKTDPKTPAEILYGGPTSGSFEELKARRRGYPQEPGPDIDTPEAKELRKAYDRHNPRYHRYVFKEPLCEMTTPGCTAEAAYAALLRFAVPGNPKAGHAAWDGQEATAAFLGVPGGQVTVHVDADRKAVVNRTLPDHKFHDGFAQRQIVVEGNTVFIRALWRGGEPIHGSSAPEQAARPSRLPGVDRPDARGPSSSRAAVR